MNDLKYVKQTVKQSGSSFYLPMLFLPPDKKNAMFAIYAFCREVDDIVDEYTNVATAREEIAEWREEIARLFNSEDVPTHPIARVLWCYKDEFALQKPYFDEILAGMEMDLENSDERISYDMFHFKKYCYRVASCVGLLSIGVFGGGNINKEIEKFALHLGHALQITNIIRDIEEDAEINRIYVPIEILEKYHAENLTPSELCECEDLPNIKADLGKMAKKHFKQAWEQFPSERKYEFYPARLMGKIYQGYLTKMEQEDWQSAGCSVSIWEKLKAAFF